MKNIKLIVLAVLLFAYYFACMTSVFLSGMQQTIPEAWPYLLWPVGSIFLIIPNLFKYIYPPTQLQTLYNYKLALISVFILFSSIWVLGLIQHGFIIVVLALIYLVPFIISILKAKPIIKLSNKEEATPISNSTSN